MSTDPSRFAVLALLATTTASTVFADGKAANPPVKLTEAKIAEAITWGMKWDVAAAELPKKLGAPLTGRSKALVWYYALQRIRGNSSCRYVALLSSPSGQAVVKPGVMNGDVCDATKLTEKAVEQGGLRWESDGGSISMKESLSFEAAAKRMQAKLGPPSPTDAQFSEFQMLSWSYLEKTGKCKNVVLFATLNGFGMEQAKLDCK